LERHFHGRPPPPSVEAPSPQHIEFIPDKGGAARRDKCVKTKGGKWALKLTL